MWLYRKSVQVTLARFHFTASTVSLNRLGTQINYFMNTYNIVKYTELRGKSIRKVHNHMAKSNNKTHQKRMDKNCHIPDLVQAFSNVENGGLNLVL